MNPTIENPGKISEFTMRYLEAMGWYKAEPDQWEYYSWGRKEGCDFFERQCSQEPRKGEEPEAAVVSYFGEDIGKGYCRLN